MEKQFQITIRFGLNGIEQFKDFCKKLEKVKARILDYGEIKVLEED